HYALIIAECDLILRAIRRERIILIERCRYKGETALAKGDNSLALAKIRALKTRLAFTELERMGVTLDNGLPTIPKHMEVDKERRVYQPVDPPAEERREVEMFCEAIPGLRKLDRYERRARARRKRAIRDFVGMKSWENNP